MADPELVHFAAGLLLGLTLAMPPGPVMAMMASAAARGRPGESLRLALGATAADVTWLGFALLGFVAVLHDRPRLVGALGFAGAGLLLFMAWTTYRSARAGLPDVEGRGSFKVGYATIIASPFNLAWWLANGALLLLTLGAWGIAGMFVAILGYAVFFTYAMRWLGARVPRLAEGVAWTSAVLLAGFAAWAAWTSAGYLGLR